MAPLHPSFPPLAVVNKTEKRRHSNHFNLFLFHLFLIFLSHIREIEKKFINAFLSRIILDKPQSLRPNSTPKIHFKKKKIKAPTGQVGKYTYQSKNNRVVFGLAPCSLERRKLPCNLLELHITTSEC